MGVTRQYCGQLGKQDNCSMAMSLAVAISSRSSALDTSRAMSSGDFLIMYPYALPRMGFSSHRDLYCPHPPSWHDAPGSSRVNAEGAGAFGKAISMADDCADEQIRTALPQHMAVVVQNSWRTAALPEPPRIAIDSRLVRVVAAAPSFPVSVNIMRATSWPIVRAVLWPEAFVAGLRLNQRAVHREMLAREQVLPVG